MVWIQNSNTNIARHWLPTQTTNNTENEKSRESLVILDMFLYCFKSMMSSWWWWSIHCLSSCWSRWVCSWRSSTWSAWCSSSAIGRGVFRFLWSWQFCDDKLKAWIWFVGLLQHKDIWLMFVMLNSEVLNWRQFSSFWFRCSKASLTTLGSPSMSWRWKYWWWFSWWQEIYRFEISFPWVQFRPCLNHPGSAIQKYLNIQHHVIFNIFQDEWWFEQYSWALFKVRSLLWVEERWDILI